MIYPAVYIYFNFKIIHLDNNYISAEFNNQIEGQDVNSKQEPKPSSYPSECFQLSDLIRHWVSPSPHNIQLKWHFCTF